MAYETNGKSYKLTTENLLSHQMLLCDVRITMHEENLLKVLKTFEQNAKWFSEKSSEIMDKYEGKTIAVKDQRIVAVKSTLDEVLKELELRKEDIGSIYIATIPEKAIAFIL